VWEIVKLRIYKFSPREPMPRRPRCIYIRIYCFVRVQTTETRLTAFQWFLHRLFFHILYYCFFPFIILFFSFLIRDRFFHIIIIFYGLVLCSRTRMCVCVYIYAYTREVEQSYPAQDHPFVGIKNE